MYAADAVRHAGGEVGRVLRADTVLHERFRRHLVTIVSLTFVIDVVSALLAYAFEHDAKGTQIKTLGDALFWTTTQLLTVSSSLVNPLSAGGKVLDVLMEIWAMIVVASLTASLGSFLVHKHRP